MVKMINFMLYVFYHNKKFRGKGYWYLRLRRYTTSQPAEMLDPDLILPYLLF